MILISFLTFITIQRSKFDTPLDQMNRTCVFGSYNSIEKLYFQYQKGKIRFQKRFGPYCAWQHLAIETDKVSTYGEYKLKESPRSKLGTGRGKSL